MPNNFTSSPHTIDSVMATAYPPGVGYVWIEDISWTEMVNAGDQLVIKDRNGNLILDTKATGANQFERFGKLNRVNGYQITVLGSGKVTIVIK